MGFLLMTTCRPGLPIYACKSGMGRLFSLLLSFCTCCTNCYQEAPILRQYGKSNTSIDTKVDEQR